MIYELKLTQQEMQIVGAALGKLPYEVVAPVVKSINDQLASASASQPNPAPSGETSEQPPQA